MTLSLTWSGIMAAGIIVGLVIFILVVLRAERRSKRGVTAQESAPRREVIGGRFDSSGGRQVMPRRDAPADTPDESRR